jgi:lincosamide nucleotidyltransferase A/C/D/E
MAATEVVALVDGFDAAEITVWLDGGWGVDALLEEETREHDDLDLVLAIEDLPKSIRLLAERGYEHATGPPTNPVFYNQTGRKVDLHLVEFDDDGNGLFTMGDATTWTYPARGFAGRGSVVGREVRCLTAEVQVITHAGYELDADDIADLRALRERFGVELRPEPA